MCVFLTVCVYVCVCVRKLHLLKSGDQSLPPTVLVISFLSLSLSRPVGSRCLKSLTCWGVVWISINIKHSEDPVWGFVKMFISQFKLTKETLFKHLPVLTEFLPILVFEDFEDFLENEICSEYRIWFFHRFYCRGQQLYWLFDWHKPTDRILWLSIILPYLHARL